MDGTTLEAIRTALRGPVITAEDPEYDEARTAYNAMIDRRPAAVVRCRDAADVMDAVGVVRDTGLEIAVRGGAHSGPGLCLVDDGVTVDLSPMSGVRVDPVAQDRPGRRRQPARRPRPRHARLRPGRPRRDRVDDRRRRA